ncbi:hypothetical protein GLYMA_15G206233v4 [Glycine max]|nr:hypothetical protein GLYMA_15G206233v4 [Glycine max]KAH1148108.1 hypothetical protein GYH30_042993 [Glycine max]
MLHSSSALIFFVLIFKILRCQTKKNQQPLPLCL